MEQTPAQKVAELIKSFTDSVSEPKASNARHAAVQFVKTAIKDSSLSGDYDGHGPSFWVACLRDLDNPQP